MIVSKYLTVLLLTGLVLFSGCSDKDSEPASPAEPADAALVVPEVRESPQTFSGIGIVRNITPSRTFIVIEHREIEGFMGAMTMPFAIRDQTLLENIALDSEVDFTLTVQGTEVFVSALKPVRN